jgi:hypothetical protein
MSWIWGAAILLAATRSWAVTETTQTFKLLDPKTKQVLVTGAEHVRAQNGAVVRHTEYRAGNELVATEDATIDGKRLMVQQYRFRNLKTGEEATLAVKAGKASATYRKAKGRGVDEEVIDWSKSSLHGKLLPELLLGNWDELQRGEAVEFDLYVPFRMDTIRFRATKNDKPMVVSQRKLTTFRVEPTNFVIRQLAPTIYFTFEDSAARGLLHYRGPSLVDIAGEKNRTVDIFFQTPESPSGKG